MKAGRIAIALLFLTMAPAAFSLEPDQILVIANASNPASIKIAEYYCAKRNVPKENILRLTLDAPLDNSIARNKYDEQIASPVRKKRIRSSGRSHTSLRMRRDVGPWIASAASD